MTDVTIYHNPRCSKSRNTLALLQEKGISATVVLYLETPPDARLIRDLLKKLDMTAGELLRRGEADYQSSGLGKTSAEADIIAAMAQYPKLIERPIVVRGGKAVLGRPPENALALID